VKVKSDTRSKNPDSSSEATGDCEQSKPEEEKALNPGRKAQIDKHITVHVKKEEVNVKRMTPIDKHKWGQKS
jgi:hypothetical protein